MGKLTYFRGEVSIVLQTPHPCYCRLFVHVLADSLVDVLADSLVHGPLVNGILLSVHQIECWWYHALYLLHK